MPNIPGSKMLSLDDLARMTAEIQEAEKNGTLGPDGRPLQRVDTRDLTPRDDYDPLQGAVLAEKQPPLHPAGDEIAMDTPVQQYVPPALRGQEKLKPTAITDIAPMTPPKKVGAELQEKWIKDLDNALERDKQAQWDNVIMPLYEKKLEEKALADMGVTDDDVAISADPGMDSIIPSDDGYKISEGDLEDMEEQGYVAPPQQTESIPKFDFGGAEKVYEEAPIAQTQAVPVVAPPPIPVTEPVKFEPVTVEEEPKLAPPIKIDPPKESIGDIDLDNIFGEDTSSEISEAVDDSDEEIELSEEEQKEEIAAMQKTIRQEIRPISKVIDISQFKVASKPITTSRVLANMTVNKAVHTANWYMQNAGRPFTMSELAGPEIEKLNPSAETGLSELMRNRERFGIFYDHIMDANKPSTFEAWAKTVPHDDVSALYYGAYRASFSHGSNLLPYYCSNPKCKHSFMQHKPIDSMVRFADDAAKERAKNIMALDPTGVSLSIESRIFQVSDDLCMSFHTPSIYNIEFEIPVLPKKFRDKYEELMYYISCIEDIYQIDHTNNFLIKMETKVEPNNIAKTVANKYKAFAAILQRLTADQYYSIYSYIKEVKEDHTGEVIFEYPETICPQCNQKIEAVEMDPMQMLFTRLRLPTILVL